MNGAEWAQFCGAKLQQIFNNTKKTVKKSVAKSRMCRAQKAACCMPGPYAVQAGYFAARLRSSSSRMILRRRMWW
ncbi:MAG: hypothetical protein K2N76_01780, partial [Muribaculaceae bacterium]|nr:hypothetical protein [Muribaculaceae bacterium]